VIYPCKIKYLSNDIGGLGEYQFTTCFFLCLLLVFRLAQWRLQVVGTWARAPWRLREFFSLGYTLKQVVWFGLVLCQTLTQHYLFSRISLWNDAITGYNGASAKVVFTARRHALARSLLSAGVRPSVHRVRVLYCIRTAEDIIKHLSRPGSPIILVFDPQALIPNSRRIASSAVQNTQI